VGGGLAASTGDFATLPFLAALLGALWIQIGTNFANDYSDFVRGADTEERKGSMRVTQSGLLSPESVRFAAGVSFGIAMAFGVYLVTRGGWPIVGIGLASIIAGVCYTGGPWPFGYHGLGDLFVFVFFGPVAVAGTVYVQTLEWRPDTLLAGAAVGALTTAILVVNNLRDRPTDAAAGKRTLAVLIGDRATRAQYVALLLVAAAIPAIGIATAGWPRATLLAMLALLTAVGPARAVFRHDDPRDLNVVLVGTAKVAGLYGLAFAVGCLI
ncbi:MAG: 1,4-dihydroxy-2-naphthoate polyprenyltransferase, partial [Gemmatimonadota bacterium]|nr:1,4-dihydroxy-2-naphthoate polyprenyltransferase [Gemmatimonadota bacterium]